MGNLSRRIVPTNRPLGSGKTAPKPTEPKPEEASQKRRANGNAKKLISMRLDPEVIEAFRATGAGWQARINAALRKAAGL